MERAWWLLLTVIFSLSLSACQTDEPDVPSQLGVNLLVVAEGQVELEREGWLEPQPTGLGALLYENDQIRPSDDAEVIVLCDDDKLTLWYVPAGVWSSLTDCPEKAKPAIKRNGPIAQPRGADKDIPIILSPRATKILDQMPLLSWREVVDATEYTVRVRGEGLKWEKKTSDTKMVYDGEALEENVAYKLIVEVDNGGSSADEGVPNLSFRVLGKEQAQQVRQTGDKIDDLPLPDYADYAKSLARSHLYAHYGLNHKAIEELEQVVEQNPAPSVHRLLGDLYLQIQLPEWQEHYSTTLDLAQAAGDLEEQALVQVGLAQIYHDTQKDKDKAIDSLNQAIQLYQTLGDEERVDELNQWLAELKP